MRLIAIALLPGCAFYAPNSFRDTFTPFPGMQLTTSCLDLAVATAADALATGPVVEYSFGNRCARAVTVDLAHLTVVGRMADGSSIHLTARDPQRELRPLSIGGWSAGQELIEYTSPNEALPLTVCVDVGAIQAEVDPVSRWVCVGGPT